MGKSSQILASTGNREYPLPEKNGNIFSSGMTIFFHWEVPVYFYRNISQRKWNWLLSNNMAWVSFVYCAGKYNLSILPDKIQYAESWDVLLWGKEKA